MKTKQLPQEWKEEEIKQILRETKEAYQRNLDNIDKIDSKIVQLFTLIIALILLFINIIKFPKDCLLMVIYLLVAISFTLSLLILIFAYNPRKYGATDYNKLIKKYEGGDYKNYFELLKAITGRKAEDIDSIKENMDKKVFLFKLCTYLSLIGLVFIIILKIFQGG